MDLSLTQVIAILIFLGAIIYFIVNLPSISSLVNVIISVIYGLFVFNIINFTSNTKVVIFSLLILGILSIFQVIVSSRKYAVFGSTIQLVSSIIGILIYTNVIVNLKFIEKIIK
ncbi:MAG TPA: hypothetical protein PKW55_05575 [Spirochaetota bacterium]|nr:hypothetical protein [Spirochaetota bacterium]HOM37579.1 hypothetical protein [Spirochaetota bacterium]HPQ49450.1 hypothetical protein [Spirochaetota bacterium]